MPSTRGLRGIAIICLLLNGATLSAICVGWKIEHISLLHQIALLGCAAGATLLCILRLINICLHDASSISRGGWQLEALFSAIEVAVLAVLIGLLYTSEPAQNCVHGAGSVPFCRVVIIVTATTGLALFLAVSRGLGMCYVNSRHSRPGHHVQQIFN